MPADYVVAGRIGEPGPAGTRHLVVGSVPGRYTDVARTFPALDDTCIHADASLPPGGPKRALSGRCVTITGEPQGESVTGALRSRQGRFAGDAVPLPADH